MKSLELRLKEVGDDLLAFDWDEATHYPDAAAITKIVEEWVYEVDEAAATRYADSLLSALLNNL